MKFHLEEQIGPKRARTPEGYLVCFDVPIARIGTQLYGAHEIPVEPGPDGTIQIDREESEVFKPESVASWAGKPFVIEHPEVDDPQGDGWDVNPSNWSDFARGLVMNPRRGEGALSGCVVADIFVTHPDAIRAIDDGKTEVSGGYQADYETLAPGRGRQINIFGNHVALVDHGRCGTRCSIGDEDTMANRSSGTLDKLMSTVRRAFKDKDEKALEAGMKEFKDEITGGGEMVANAEEPSAAGEANHVHIHLNGSPGTPGAANGGESHDEDPIEENHEVPPGDIAKRIEVLEAGMKEIVALMRNFTAEEETEAEAVEENAAEEPTGDETELMDDPEPSATGDDTELMEDPVPAATGDRRRSRDGKLRIRIKDSSAMSETFQNVLAQAEILSPGIPVPTFDSKRPAATTADSLCRLRRRAIDRAWRTEDGRAAIEPVLGSSNISRLPRMTCDSVRTLFNGAVELVRSTNNSTAGGRRSAARDSGTKTVTLGDINKGNRERYGQPAR